MQGRALFVFGSGEDSNDQICGVCVTTICPYGALMILLFLHIINEPPVGFEPTTSRLLSGCSAN